MSAKFEIVDFPAMTLIGLDADFYGGMSPKFNGQEVLGPLWGKVNRTIAELGLAGHGNMIGATRSADSGEEGLLNQFVGLVVDELPSDLHGLEVLNLPAMRLATYEHHGGMHLLVASIQKFYNEVLPDSGCAKSDDWHLEIYDERFDLESEDSVMLIATPILA